MIACNILFVACLAGATPSPLQIDHPRVDFGEVRASKPLLREFTLKNTGKGLLHITDVLGSCGCFRREVATKELAPGASTTLTLAINLLALPDGANSWRVTVRYRVGEEFGEQTIVATATVRKEISVEPVSLFLTTEKDATATLTVTDRRAKPLTVTGVKVGIKDVSGTAGRVTADMNKQTQTVTVHVGTMTPAGQYSEEVCLTTDDPDCPELRIPIRLVKRAADEGVSALPANPLIRFAKEQATGSAIVRLRSADGKAVVIEGLETEHDAVTAKWVPGPETMATVRLTLDRAKLTTSGGTVVTVRLRGPKPETVLLPLAWLLP